VKALKEMYRSLLGMPLNNPTLEEVTPRWLASKVSDPPELGGRGVASETALFDVGPPSWAPLAAPPWLPRCSM
jgi:hypothetical protein